MRQEKKSQQAGQRRVKVCGKSFPRDFNRYVSFPEIRLSGKWLLDTGFSCGQTVTVKHSRNKIIITIDNDI